MSLEGRHSGSGGGVGSRSMSLVPKLSLAPGGRTANNRVIINVGGTRYETYRSTLKAIPDTRLSWLTETTAHNPDYDPCTGEYFFDRHPGVFTMILNYYRTGKLHAPTDVCGPLFEEELNFWGIDEKQIEPCCWSNYSAHRDAQETLADFDMGDFDNCDQDDGYDETVAQRFGIVEDAPPEQSLWSRVQPKVWALLEDPKSSRGAQVVALISLVFVLSSIAAFCMETHIMFREAEGANSTLPVGLSVYHTQTLTKPYVFLDVVEYTCIVYFTLEIIIRFIFCPSKTDHLKQFLNWVDLFSVLPFYTKTILLAVDPSLGDSVGLYFLNALRLIRIFRIMKLTRHVSGLKILGHTLKASAKELLLLILVLTICVLIFACLIYYAEQIQEDPKNDFRDIPRGFWWAVVTMTTLGYGDMYPRTVLGYIVGAVCALCGLLMLALPVPVIVNNFTLYYSHAQARMKLPRKPKNILVGAANALKNQGSGRSSLETVASEGTTPNGSCRSLHEAEDKTDRKRSDDSEASSCDSGIKTASANGEAMGISVIYTDELAESVRPHNRLSTESRAHKPSPTGRRQSLLPNGKAGTGRRSSTLGGGTSRRRSLFPSTITDVDV